MPRPHKDWHDELPDELVPLSRALCRILRHDGPAHGLFINSKGWCRLDELLQDSRIKKWSEDEVRYVLAHSWVRGGYRFELDNAEKWVRATGGHSWPLEEEDEAASWQQEIESVSKHEQDNLPSQAPASVQPSQTTAHEENAQEIAAATAGVDGVDASSPKPANEKYAQVAARMEGLRAEFLAGESKNELPARTSTSSFSDQHIRPTDIVNSMDGSSSAKTREALSSMYRLWRYTSNATHPDRGMWQCTTDPGSCFHTHAPKTWTLFLCPQNNKTYWWDSVTEEWFFSN